MISHSENTENVNDINNSDNTVVLCQGISDQKIENNTHRLKNQSIIKTHISVMTKKGKDEQTTNDSSLSTKVDGNSSTKVDNISSAKIDTSSSIKIDINELNDKHIDTAHLSQLIKQLPQQLNKENNSVQKKQTTYRRKSKDNHNTNNYFDTNIISANPEQLLHLRKLIDDLIVTNNIDTNDADNNKRDNKCDIKHESYSAPTPTVYMKKKIHKHIGFDESSFSQVYSDITKEHDVQIKITQTYVRNFIKGIITDVKQATNEKWPRCMNLETIVKSIVDSLPKTLELDNFYSYVAEYLVAKSSQHYFYDLLASYIAVKRLHSITTPNFLLTVKLLQENLDKNNDQSPILSDEVFDIISRHHVRLQEAIQYSRDYDFDFFGIKTMERSYLYKLQFTKFKIIERPQHMIMRVAIGIHGEDIDSAIETYDLISQKYFTHATPTLFNAGTKRPQMSSCFLQSVSDSIESIFNAVTDIALTSKWSGGIGVHLSSLRSRGSLIRGTNGLSSGIIPLCVLLNKLAKYINQGGKRNGSIAAYLEPHHPDIFDFCELRKNTGNDDNRARDLYLALWVPTLFMDRVRNDEMWSLMCPDECPGLNLVHSEEYNKLYEKYESEGRYVKQVKARDLWKHILEAQSETGFPYVLYKDNANKKSNQKNLGTIRSSNLCAEIIQYSDDDETSVCNLSSLCLPMYIETNTNGKKVFNHEKLIKVCRVAVRNLDKIIDRNYYPTEKTKRSNMRHRPMGVGIQGLADVYNIMGFSFDSPEAYDINKRIFETIYYACIDESKELAKRFGPYSTFKGSPASQGKLQFHLWGISEDQLLMGYDWKKLIGEVVEYGLRNSLLTALMPTASTSQIMGNAECMEPYMSNIFKRSTIAGEFIVVNKNLMKDLIHLDLWDNDMRKRLIIENGSVQSIDSIPEQIKSIYKTAFEIKQMHIVHQSSDRGIFIDQSQSLNVFMPEPDFDILTSILFDAHDRGNKTGMYYYRSLPAINPINFGIDVDDIKRLTGRDVNTGSYNNIATKNGDEILVQKKTNISTKGSEEPVSKSVKKIKNSLPPNDKSSIGSYCEWKPGMKFEDCLECGS